jgi:hypothetical protein
VKREVRAIRSFNLVAVRRRRPGKRCEGGGGGDGLHDMSNDMELELRSGDITPVPSEILYECSRLGTNRQVLCFLSAIKGIDWPWHSAFHREMRGYHTLRMPDTSVDDGRADLESAM